MNSELILPMMMYGKFKSTRVKKDKEGNTLYELDVKGNPKLDKKGKKKPIKKNVTIYHKEEDGDPGIFPSVNHIYERMRGGRQKPTQAALDLKEKWAVAAQMWMKDNNWTKTELEKVVVEVWAYFPNESRKRDTNNVFKLMMDAFDGIIYDNDFYGLPRVMDFDVVQEGERPYFRLNIYKKDDEDEIMRERYKQSS
jgi:Holliday junction resolvase RusA-like endonuclease